MGSVFNQEELSCSSRGSRDPNLKPLLLGKRSSHPSHPNGIVEVTIVVTWLVTIPCRLVERSPLSPGFFNKTQLSQLVTNYHWPRCIIIWNFGYGSNSQHLLCVFIRGPATHSPPGSQVWPVWPMILSSSRGTTFHPSKNYQCWPPWK